MTSSEGASTLGFPAVPLKTPIHGIPRSRPLKTGEENIPHILDGVSACLRALQLVEILELYQEKAETEAG